MYVGMCLGTGLCIDIDANIVSQHRVVDVPWGLEF